MDRADPQIAPNITYALRGRLVKRSTVDKSKIKDKRKVKPMVGLAIRRNNISMDWRFIAIGR